MEEQLAQMNQTLQQIHEFLVSQLGGSNEAHTKPWTDLQPGDPLPNLSSEASVQEALTHIYCATREMLAIERGGSSSSGS